MEKLPKYFNQIQSKTKNDFKIQMKLLNFTEKKMLKKSVGKNKKN